MKKYFEILKQCKLFENIEKDDLIKMLGCLGAYVEFFDKKYTIISEGNPAKYIGIVLSGSAQMVRYDYFGNRSIVGVAKPGQTFAEAFACAGVESIPVTIMANDPCEVMLIDCNHILHTCNNNCAFHQRLIFNLMRELATKNVMFHQKIEITSKRSTRDKLMTYLAIQARSAGSNRFEIPFNRQELADYLEVERSGLSAEISKLKNEGILESRKNNFELL